jgi:uncharacterized membrane protein
MAQRVMHNMTSRLAVPLAWSAMVLLAIGFLASEVATYARFTPESYGRFWPQRVWLSLHLAGGSIALLVGPLQFFRRIRKRWPQLHRWIGRVYVLSVVIAAIGAFRLGVVRHPVLGFGFSAALFLMGVAWVAATAMAYVAIRRRAFDIHSQWMVRSYILTFSFVSFRVIIASTGALGLMRIAPPTELAPMFVWAAWVLPLLVAEITFSARRLRRRVSPDKDVVLNEPLHPSRRSGT